MRLPEKKNCILEELRIYLDPSALTNCTVPYNMMADQNAMIMNERVRYINDIIREIQKKSILPVRLLNVARMIQDSLPLPHNSSSDDIHLDKPKGLEWLNGVFQRHINDLESDLLETARFTYGSSPRPCFFSVRPLTDRLGEKIDSRGSSVNSRSRQLGSTPMEKDEIERSTP